MIKQKRVLCLLLALLMLLNIGMVVFATDDEPAEQEYYEKAENDAAEEVTPVEILPPSSGNSEEHTPIIDLIIERHIREHYNAAFTSLNTMRLVNVMYVKNLIVDEDLRGDMSTIEEIMGDIFAHPEVVVTQTVGAVPVFELSTESRYYVALINTMLSDPGTQVLDYAFAVWNNFGMIVDGHYDFESGIAYIPKHVMQNADGLIEFFNIQAQLLQSRTIRQSRSGELMPLMSAYFVMDEVEKEAVAIEADNVLAFHTTIQTDPGLRAADISVLVNGIAVPAEMFHYDRHTGEITLLQSASNVFSVQVIHDDPPDTGFVMPEATNIWAMPTHGAIEIMPGRSMARFPGIPFRYVREAEHSNNVAMYPIYNHADLGRLSWDMFGNSAEGYVSRVNLDELVVANRNILLYVQPHFRVDHWYADQWGPFMRVEQGNVERSVGGVMTPFLMTRLICADIATPLGDHHSVNVGPDLVSPGMEVFIRVLDQTDTHLLLGFTTQRVNRQAGVGVLRFERADTLPPPPDEGALRIIKTSGATRS